MITLTCDKCGGKIENTENRKHLVFYDKDYHLHQGCDSVWQKLLKKLIKENLNAANKEL